MSVIAAVDRPVLPFKETSGKYYVKQEEFEYSLLHKYYPPFKVRQTVLRQRVLDRKTPENYPLKLIDDLELKKKALIVGVIKKSRIPKPQIVKDLMYKERVIPKPIEPPKSWRPPQEDELDEEDWFDPDGELSDLPREEYVKLFIEHRRKVEEKKRERRYQQAMNSSWWWQNEPGPSVQIQQNEQFNDTFDEQRTLYDNGEDDEDDTFRISTEKPIYLELEDESNRIRLSENVIRQSNITTGCIVGILGQMIESSQDDINFEFHVQSIVYPSTGRPLIWPKNNPKGIVAIISGLELVGMPDKDAAVVNSINLFADWLIGKRCSEEEKELSSRVERVIIAGNCLGYKKSKEMVQYISTRDEKQKAANTPQMPTVKQLDRIISFIAEKNVPVIMVPGHGDPYLHAWPQQPIPMSFFSQTELRGNIHCCTNPASFQLGKLDFLVTSGYNVSDILDQDRKSEPLDIMEAMLKWQHLAPTAPVTIESYPMDFIDPFIMDRRPHIYIGGNQEKTGSRWIKSSDGRTLLISVPRYSQNRMVTLLDLETMELSYRQFDWMERIPKRYCMFLGESFDSNDPLQHLETFI